MALLAEPSGSVPASNGMKKFTPFLVIIALIIAGAWLVYISINQPQTPEKELLPLDQSISDGTVTISYSTDYGLAATDGQLLSKSYIPPCDSGFDYCIYYVGSAYEGTNFESSGVTFNKRPNLSTKDACLNTLPQGYTSERGLSHTKLNTPEYSTVLFSPLGDAATGHYSEGKLYRLSYGTQCYEFETRIGMSQFANYEPGAIEEFTAQDKTDVENELQRIIERITLGMGNNRVSFPKPAPETDAMPRSMINFEESGHLVKDNPGLKPGIWYLVYEAPGAPALTVELLFDQNSYCVYDGTQGTCSDVLLPSSALTEIKGFEENGVVRVVSAVSGSE